jgi:thymidine phosphorylase
VGRACIALGAGRGCAEDTIDPAVGFDRIVKVGSPVETGDLVARVHARDEAGAGEAGKRFLGGFACE